MITCESPMLCESMDGSGCKWHCHGCGCDDQGKPIDKPDKRAGCHFKTPEALVAAMKFPGAWCRLKGADLKTVMENGHGVN